jgi:tetratricopeptide (TPR) repeat protein
MSSPTTQDTSAPPPLASIADPAINADIQKLRKDLNDTQEKLLGLREKEIFTLREQVSGLGLRINIITVVAGIIVGLLAFFGIKQYRDLEDLIHSTFQKQFERSFGYYDKLMRAQLLVGDEKYSAAESLYRELFEMRPDDEIVFFKLVDCLESNRDYDGAIGVVDSAKKTGLFPRKCKALFSFNNAGWAMLVQNIDQPDKLDEAFRALRRAEQIGINEDDRDIAYPYGNLGLYYAATGDLEKAKYYAVKSRDVQQSPRDDPSNEDWFKRLHSKRPLEAETLREILCGPETAKTPSTTMPTKR